MVVVLDRYPQGLYSCWSGCSLLTLRVIRMRMECAQCLLRGQGTDRVSGRGFLSMMAADNGGILLNRNDEGPPNDEGPLIVRRGSTKRQGSVIDLSYMSRDQEGPRLTNQLTNSSS